MFKSIYRIYEGARLLFRMYRVYRRAKNIRYIQRMRRSGTPVKPKRKVNLKDNIFSFAIRTVRDTLLKLFLLPEKKKKQYIREPRVFDVIQSLSPEIVEVTPKNSIFKRNEKEYSYMNQISDEEVFRNKVRHMEMDGYEIEITHGPDSTIRVKVEKMGISESSISTNYLYATERLVELEKKLTKNIARLQSQIINETSPPIHFYGNSVSLQEMKNREAMQKQMDFITEQETLLRQEFLMAISTHSLNLIKDTLNKTSP